MAKSESQGLQIAVIIFAFLTIALSISTFYFFNEWSTADQARMQAETDQQQANAAVRKADDDIRALAQIIGASTDGTSQEMVTKSTELFEEDKTKYAETFPENDQNYSKALELLMNGFMTEKANLQEEMNKLVALDARVDKLENEWQQKLAQVTQDFNTKAADFAQTATGLQEERDAELTEKKRLADQIAEKQRELTDLQQTVNDQIGGLKTALDRAEVRVRGMKEREQALLQESFEVADGEVRWVSPSGGRVWINLGRSDNLRPGISFSVWPTDVSTFAGKEQIKGSVEVTKLIGDGMAEARITQDYVVDPILPGDKIFTPLWHPGREEHFAMAGVMDIDGNGSDEYDLVKELIKVRGGVLDKWLTQDGQPKGEMSIHTRYLVTGEMPKEYTKQYLEMMEEASKLGVEKMTLDEFLDYIGYVGASKVVDLGRYSDPENFAPVARPNESRPVLRNDPSGRGSFRSRRPPRGEKGGAY